MTIPHLCPQASVCVCVSNEDESVEEFADIGINTASSYENSTCFVPELVAGSLHQLDQGSASDPLTARSMSALSQPFLHAYETSSCLVTLSMSALIPAIYRALLKSAVSETCHRIRTTKRID